MNHPRIAAAVSVVLIGTAVWLTQRSSQSEYRPSTGGPFDAPVELIDRSEPLDQVSTAPNGRGRSTPPSSGRSLAGLRLDQSRWLQDWKQLASTRFLDIVERRVDNRPPLSSADLDERLAGGVREQLEALERLVGSELTPEAADRLRRYAAKEELQVLAAKATSVLAADPSGTGAEPLAMLLSSEFARLGISADVAQRNKLVSMLDALEGGALPPAVDRVLGDFVRESESNVGGGGSPLAPAVREASRAVYGKSRAVLLASSSASVHALASQLREGGDARSAALEALVRSDSPTSAEECEELHELIEVGRLLRDGPDGIDAENEMRLLARCRATELQEYLWEAAREPDQVWDPLHLSLYGEYCCAGGIDGVSGLLDCAARSPQYLTADLIVSVAESGAIASTDLESLYQLAPDIVLTRVVERVEPALAAGAAQELATRVLLADAHVSDAILQSVLVALDRGGSDEAGVLGELAEHPVLGHKIGASASALSALRVLAEGDEVGFVRLSSISGWFAEPIVIAIDRYLSGLQGSDLSSLLSTVAGVEVAHRGAPRLILPHCAVSADAVTMGDLERLVAWSLVAHDPEERVAETVVTVIFANRDGDITFNDTLALLHLLDAGGWGSPRAQALGQDMLAWIWAQR